MFDSYLMQCILIHSSLFFFFKQKTAYEMRISDWSSDVCSSDLDLAQHAFRRLQHHHRAVDVARLADGGIDQDAATRVEPHRLGAEQPEIGRASGRERVCQYV